MLLREKANKDGEPVAMGWDEAQAALAAGTHVPADAADAEDAGDDAPPAEAEGKLKPGGDKAPGDKPAASPAKSPDRT